MKILNEVETSKAIGIDNAAGKFKNGWKALSPKLYKKGLKTDGKNFSPISLLPLISKIIDQILFYVMLYFKYSHLQVCSHNNSAHNEGKTQNWHQTVAFVLRQADF